MCSSARRRLALLAAAAAACAACARDFAVPEPPLGPALAAMEPAAGFAGDRVVLGGERLAGVGLGAPRVFFAGGAAGKVIEAAPDRVVVEVPAVALTGPLMLRTTAGEARSVGQFTFLGLGRLSEDVAVRYHSVSVPTTPSVLAVDQRGGRVAALIETAEVLALVERRSGEVRWLGTPRLSDVAAAPDGTLWMLGLDGLVPVDAEGRIGPALALPAKGAQLGLAPDGTWACVSYLGPRAVGMVDLVARTAGPLSPLTDPVFVATQVAALPGPPRACLASYVSTLDPLRSVMAEIVERAGAVEAGRKFLFAGYLGDAAVSVPEQAAYARFTSPREVARVHLGSGETDVMQLPLLRMSGLLLGPAADQILVTEHAQGQVIELDRQSLAPVRALSLGGAPKSLATLDAWSEIVVGDAAPLRLIFADARTGTPRGERLLTPRAIALAPHLDYGQFLVALEGSARVLSFSKYEDGYVTGYELRFPGAVRRLAATGGVGRYVLAASETPGGARLSLQRVSVEVLAGGLRIYTPVDRLDAPAAEVPACVAVAGCAPPWPCPFAPDGAVLATLRGAGAILHAGGQALADADTSGPWIFESRPGLRGPGACALSPDLPLGAVGEKSPPALVWLELGGAPAVVARAPLGAEPAVVAFVPRTRALLALAGGRLWRADSETEVVEIPLPWPAGALVVSPDGGAAYLGAADRAQILAVDLRTRTVRAHHVPAGAEALAIDANGENLLGIRADLGTLFQAE